MRPKDPVQGRLVKRLLSLSFGQTGPYIVHIQGGLWSFPIGFDQRSAHIVVLDLVKSVKHQRANMVLSLCGDVTNQ